MLARLILITSALILAACMGGGKGLSTADDPGGPAAEGSSWSADFFAEARADYEAHCASCHDAGASEAPAVGVKEDWDNRSPLWTAILFEHAKAGYLKMPAKGGAAELTDEEVSAAAEYMLTLTYPELPKD